MTRLAVDIPDKMAAEVHRYLAEGWFVSEEELLRAALADFLRRNRTELMERFHERDIEWAINQRKRTA